MCVCVFVFDVSAHVGDQYLIVACYVANIQLSGTGANQFMGARHLCSTAKGFWRLTMPSQLKLSTD